MEVLLVSEDLLIESHKGKYAVKFTSDWERTVNSYDLKTTKFIIDENISNLYQDELTSILSERNHLLINANEENKSLDKFPKYVQSLVDLGLKRGHTLVAIGGGITQDIACFLATTMFRGLEWIFIPTTLLAQSDSCIGSKSSINSGNIKNILGTFTPPKEIILDVTFLNTLEDKDIHSGIGEMIKVHAINSVESFDKINDSYDEILLNKNTMESFIRNSLLFKKKLIEIDEFDLGPRNVMNYGHSFGHAIETATDYKIPHGIAITIGMDMANYVSFVLGKTTEKHFSRMHSVLNKNSSLFRNTYINPELLLKALAKDKKNTSDQLRLILPNLEGEITIDLYDRSSVLEEAVHAYCAEYHN